MSVLCPLLKVFFAYREHQPERGAIESLAQVIAEVITFNKY